jgi:hypothetical protein
VICSDLVDLDWTGEIEKERKGLPVRVPASNCRRGRAGGVARTSGQRRGHDGNKHDKGNSRVGTAASIICKRRERGRLELGVGAGDPRPWSIALFRCRYDEETESGRSARGREER